MFTAIAIAISMDTTWDKSKAQVPLTTTVGRMEDTSTVIIDPRVITSTCLTSHPTMEMEGRGGSKGNMAVLAINTKWEICDGFPTTRTST